MVLPQACMPLEMAADPPPSRCIVLGELGAGGECGSRPGGASPEEARVGGPIGSGREGKTGY